MYEEKDVTKGSASIISSVNASKEFSLYVTVDNYKPGEDGKEIENANVVVNVLPPSATEYLNNEKLVKNAEIKKDRTVGCSLGSVVL